MLVGGWLKQIPGFAVAWEKANNFALQPLRERTNKLFGAAEPWEVCKCALLSHALCLCVCHLMRLLVRVHLDEYQTCFV